MRLETICGALLACYFLIGRWSPSRLIHGEDPDMIWQPRVWLAVLIAIVGALKFSEQWSGHAGAHGRGEDNGGRTGNPADLLSVAVFGLLLQVYMATTVLWAPWAAEDSPKFYEILLLIVVQLALLPLLTGGDLPLLRDTFWRVMMWLLWPMALIGIGDLLSGSERAAVLGGGANAFGRNMGLLMLGSLYLLDRPRGGWPLRTAGHVMMIVLGGLLVVMSGSRGAMLSVTCGFLVLFALRRSLNWRNIVRWSFVAIVACSAILFTEMGRNTSRMFRRRVVRQTIHDRYTAERDELFRRSLQAGLDNPVKGLGLDAFRARRGEYPHNFFLEPFAEGGVPGLLLAAGMIALAAAAICRRLDVSEFTTVASFVMVLAAAQFSGDLFDSRSVFLFSLLALVPDERRIAGVSLYGKRANGARTRLSTTDHHGLTPVARLGGA